MDNNETVLLVYKKNKYPVLLHIFNVQWVKIQKISKDTELWLWHNNRIQWTGRHLCSHAHYSHFQEKTVALKIFELGLKKYGGIPEYLLCYMDFMSHLNGNFSLGSIQVCYT